LIAALHLILRNSYRSRKCFSQFIAVFYAFLIVKLLVYVTLIITFHHIFVIRILKT